MSFARALRLRFGWAVFSYLMRGRLFFRGGHLPPSGGHPVPEAFVGVGVAPAPEAEGDSRILSCLNAAGIANVRLDFTYGDENGPPARLLAHLHANSIRIVLHLIQPSDDAKRMADDSSCQEKWRQFVQATLSRYGAMIEMVEIGSTINRKTWAGYTLSGFVRMWEIAWHEVRKTGLPLAGPSITDFEPPWNIGILAVLRARRQLPDLQTDNLFAERTGEPERYDHKVMGHFLAPLLKINLIKKARLLQRIGRDFSTPRLFSPAAFWTLPRIKRQQPNGEEKQADYLARYLLLCAASGALERAWWGPLVCHREGLVDDGVASYPELERITHYATISSENLRVRPALNALACFAKLVPGSVYEGAQTDSSALQAHAFRNDKHLVHAVWTVDGKIALLSDIYAAADLESARVFTRDGVPCDERPHFAGESVTYLCWPAGHEVRTNRKADVLANTAVHWHIPGKRYFHYCAGGWRGIVLAGSEHEYRALVANISPERLADRPSADAILRKARNLIWTVDDPRQAGGHLVVKKPLKMHLHKRILDRLKPSKGLRSWNGTAELLRRDIGAAPPVAFFEKEGAEKLLENYYICGFSEADCCARNLFIRYARGETDHLGLNDSEVYDQLSTYLLKMHRRGVFFRDLSGGNILIKKGEGSRLHFELIDTGRIRAMEDALSFFHRISDLVRISNKLRWPGRNSFMGSYFRKDHKVFHFGYKIPFALYDAKVHLKRSLKNLTRP